MSRRFRYALVLGGAVLVILLFLLASASENSDFFEKNYPWLLGLNGLVAFVLLCLVSLLLIRLGRRYRQQKFGSRLMLRLVLLFATMGIVPGALIYLVSVQFVSRSIESWFDVRVESAIESGLNLGRAALDTSLSELSTRAHHMALDLADLPLSAQTTTLSRLQEQGQFYEATVFNANGRVLTSVGEKMNLKPEQPSSAMLREARSSRGFAAIETGNEVVDKEAKPGSLRLRVVVALPGSTSTSSLQNEQRYLQLLQHVPGALASNAEALRLASNEYQVRSLGRSGLRKMYLGTLTLTLLLAIVAAIGSAFLIASNFAKPLLLLAQGTRAVADGDFSPRPIVATNDELGTLTKSFNAMTSQLQDARIAVENNRAELERAKAHLESVLANMSAGVMVLDRQFVLLSCNDSVSRILQHDFVQHLGQTLDSIAGLNPFAAEVQKMFIEQSAVADGAGVHWQKQIEIPRQIGDDETDHDITLLTRGSHLPAPAGSGYILVFDDISGLISAERSIAWGEVARRLAHEIKNPLTPIQLSAERLQMKLEDKLMPADVDLLKRATNTIVNQVSAMKRMVDDFRNYAKTPPAVLMPLDLNELVAEVLNLYNAGAEHETVQVNLAPALPLIMGDATQLRQVIHNLLQNAQDALSDLKDGREHFVAIGTEEVRYHATNGEERSAVRLEVRDNGPGFPPNILARAFEPYVTTKARGTGLGLATVKKIVDEHGGRIELQNRHDNDGETEISGARILILLLKLAPQ
ncbi:ATP-binding protein [Massilia sp. W12]|uniref:sensor histidine kinase n=1 Tax=Massilia sp. W12 TaxID=3126507 RepID=UPI0030CC1E9D